MKNILLTGATSYLGKKLIQVLSSNEEYSLLKTALHSDQESNIVKVDLTQIEDIKNVLSQFTPAIIIHTGALVNLSREFKIGKECLNVNTIGTMNLLESIKNNPACIFIYISSEEVYGNGPIPFKESQILSPPSPYAISKVAAENFITWYAKEYRLKSVIIRFGTFYGPELPENKYFSQTIGHLLKNEKVPINSGKKKRDYLYIDDAVELILKLLKADNFAAHQPLVLNAGGGKSYSLLEVITLLKKLVNSESEMQIGVIPDIITEREEWLMDIGNAYEVLEWKPEIDLAEGLKRTVEYFKNL